MNIGQASEATGLPVKTIRYYEEIGLVSPKRAANGYRDFGEVEIHQLKFMQRARSLGFSVKDCEALLSLYNDKSRASSQVKEIAKDHIGQINHKITELEGLKSTLEELIDTCQGDNRPDCPILDNLAGKGA